MPRIHWVSDREDQSEYDEPRKYLWTHSNLPHDQPVAFCGNDPTTYELIRVVAARHSESCSLRNKEHTTKKTWIRSCESMHPHQVAHPPWWKAGAAYSGNLDSSLLAVDERDAHLAAAVELAPIAARFRFERLRLPQCPVVEEVQVDCHFLWLQNHWDYLELNQPSETWIVCIRLNIFNISNGNKQLKTWIEE